MPKVDLAACQVFVTKEDYRSAAAFDALLDRLGNKLDLARTRDSAGRPAPCLAVFPEMIGAFFPIFDRAHLVRSKKTTDDALTRVALSLDVGPKVVRAMTRFRTLSANVAFLHATAGSTWRAYTAAFGAFARKHHLWVVAGSALLPANVHGLDPERFEAQDARVYNMSVTFSPTGLPAAITRKVNLVPTLEDRLGLSPGLASDVHPVQTPLGRVATLICYDGFLIPHTRKEPHFSRMAALCDAQGARVLAHPAANPLPWDGPWVFAEPGERQLRREQWQSEGIHAQLAQGTFGEVRFAVTAHLLGQVFDNHFDGRSQILARGASSVEVLAEAKRTDASLAAEEVVLASVEV